MISEEVFSLKRREKKKAGDTWMLSYSDIVTVLLCFFIIFYSLEKNIAKKTTNKIKGYSDQEGILSDHKDAEVDTHLDYAIESLSGIKGIKVVQSSSFVDIYFKEISFFNRSSHKVSLAGRNLIDKVISRLQQIDSKYRLEIHGHADKTPVSKKKKRSKSKWWKSNMELSILRALGVYKYLISKSMPKEHLSVAGHGSHKRLSPEIQEIIAQNRRISLRLQLIENN